MDETTDPSALETTAEADLRVGGFIDVTFSSPPKTSSPHRTRLNKPVRLDAVFRGNVSKIGKELFPVPANISNISDGPASFTRSKTSRNQSSEASMSIEIDVVNDNTTMEESLVIVPTKAPARKEAKVHTKAKAKVVPPTAAKSSVAKRPKSPAAKATIPAKAKVARPAATESSVARRSQPPPAKATIPAKNSQSQRRFSDEQVIAAIYDSDEEIINAINETESDDGEGESDLSEQSQQWGDEYNY